MTGQSRAVVFHIKEGRRHCHAVWSRIDGKAMKAIPLPYTKMKLMDLSRDLYFENGWKMPKGFIRKQDRSPDNFTLAQWQQAKRTGQDARTIKAALRDSWASTKTQGAFIKALKDQCYRLARGDRRSFVVVDQACEIYSLPKWIGLKTKDVKSRLTDEASIKPLAEIRAQIAMETKNRLVELGAQQDAALNSRLTQIAEKHTALKTRQRAEWESLLRIQDERQKQETLARQSRFKKGWRGLLDVLTGARRKSRQANEAEYEDGLKRDRAEKDKLIFGHLEQTQHLQGRRRRLENLRDERQRVMQDDIGQYENIRLGRQENFDRRKGQGQRRPSLER